MSEVPPKEADVDWSAIERSPEFQQLSRGRRRFAAVGTALGLGVSALYLILANLARDLMGADLIGSMSVGFLGGVLIILITWAITFAYLRRAKRTWMPLEERIRERAGQGAGR